LIDTLSVEIRWFTIGSSISNDWWFWLLVSCPWATLRVLSILLSYHALASVDRIPAVSTSGCDILFIFVSLRSRTSSLPLLIFLLKIWVGWLTWISIIHLQWHFKSGRFGCLFIFRISLPWWSLEQIFIFLFCLDWQVDIQCLIFFQWLILPKCCLFSFH